MKKTLAILLAVASVLVIAAFVSVAFAQNVNAQTLITQGNSQVSQCINSNTGVNAPPCWSNSTNSGYCNNNRNCQNQGCLGNGANGQVQAGYGCGLGMPKRCR
jgi:hypothetical protein